MMNVLEMVKNNKKVVGLAGAAVLAGVGTFVLTKVLGGSSVESDDVDDCEEEEEMETEEEE